VVTSGLIKDLVDTKSRQRKSLILLGKWYDRLLLMKNREVEKVPNIG